jgi:small subunit ribosomal protein S4
MARYTGAKLRITRRLGDLPGLTSKKGNSNSRPGQHGANQKKLTQYAIRLEEKQKNSFQLRFKRKTINELY